MTVWIAYLRTTSFQGSVVRDAPATLRLIVRDALPKLLHQALKPYLVHGTADDPCLRSPPQPLHPLVIEISAIWQVNDVENKSALATLHYHIWLIYICGQIILDIARSVIPCASP